MDETKIEEFLKSMSMEELREIASGCQKVDPRKHRIGDCANAFLVGVMADVEYSRRIRDGMKVAMEEGGQEAVKAFLDKWLDRGDSGDDGGLVGVLERTIDEVYDWPDWMKNPAVQTCIAASSNSDDPERE